LVYSPNSPLWSGEPVDEDDVLPVAFAAWKKSLVSAAEKPIFHPELSCANTAADNNANKTENATIFFI